VELAIASLCSAIFTKSSKDISKGIQGFISRLSLLSMASRNLCFAE